MPSKGQCFGIGRVLLKCRTGIYHRRKTSHSSLLFLGIGSTVIVTTILLTVAALLDTLHLGFQDRGSFKAVGVVLVVIMTTRSVCGWTFVPPTLLARRVSLSFNLTNSFIVLRLAPLSSAIIVRLSLLLTVVVTVSAVVTITTLRIPIPIRIQIIVGPIFPEFILPRFRISCDKILILRLSAVPNHMGTTTIIA